MYWLRSIKQSHKSHGYILGFSPAIFFSPKAFWRWSVIDIGYWWSTTEAESHNLKRKQFWLFWKENIFVHYQDLTYTDEPAPKRWKFNFSQAHHRLINLLRWSFYDGRVDFCKMHILRDSTLWRAREGAIKSGREHFAACIPGPKDIKVFWCF